MNQQDAELFVKLWQATSIEEVCKTMNFTIAQACSRAALFRSRGVPLRKYKRGVEVPSNYGALANLAASLDGAQQPIEPRSSP